MGPGSNPDPQPIDQLTAEPSAHSTDGHGCRRQHQGGRVRCMPCDVPTQKPAGAEEREHQDIRTRMPEPDCFGASSRGNSCPIDHPKNRGHQPTEDSRRRIPEANLAKHGTAEESEAKVE